MLLQAWDGVTYVECKEKHVLHIANVFRTISILYKQFNRVPEEPPLECEAKATDPRWKFSQQQASNCGSDGEMPGHVLEHASRDRCAPALAANRQAYSHRV